MLCSSMRALVGVIAFTIPRLPLCGPVVMTTSLWCSAQPRAPRRREPARCQRAGRGRPDSG